MHEVHRVGLRSSVPFRLEYDDGNNIAGTLSVYQDRTNGKYFVWCNIDNGPNLEKNLQGSLMAIDTAKS
jgi:hypothetical protein